MPTTASELEEKPELTEEAKKALLEDAIQKREKLAESSLEMARMFIEKGKQEIAKRRLTDIVREFGSSAAATEAKVLLGKL